MSMIISFEANDANELRAKVLGLASVMGHTPDRSYSVVSDGVHVAEVVPAVANVAEKTVFQTAAGSITVTNKMSPMPAAEPVKVPGKRGRKPKAVVDLKTSNPTAVEPAPEMEAEGGVDHEEPKAAVTIEPPKTYVPPTNPGKTTKDHVMEALKQVTTKKGVPAAREILKKFGANRLSEITEENFLPFVRECEAELSK